jgi:hypothetical protein
MALRVRFQFQTGSSLGFSIERLVDGTFWDFSTTSSTAQTFTATPTTLIQSLPEGSTNFLGSYSYTLSSTPVAQFSNGEYAVRIHNTASSNSVVGILPANMYNGDDTPYYPASIASAVLTDTTSADESVSGSLGYIINHAPSWFSTVTSSGPTAAQIATAVWTDMTSSDFSVTGSPGSILSTNLNATVSSRLAASSYIAPTTPPTAAQIATAVWTDTTSSDFSVTGSPGSILSTNLNATVSSRLAASSYVAPTTPPTAAQIATAVLTDTTLTDLATAGSLGYMIGHPPSWYVAPTSPPTPPTAAQIATAVLTDTTSTDLATAGSLGYMIGHSPSWYVAPTTPPTPPTAAQIATAVLTDTTSTDLATAGSLGYMIGHAPTWYNASGSTLTAAQIATAVWTDTTSSDFSVTGSPGSILSTNLNATVSSRLAASSYVAPTTPPTAAQIATAVLTDTTSTDLATAGSLGYMIGHSPSWYVAPTTPPTPPTAAQIATAVLTDTTSTDLATAGSLGYMIGHAPTWYNASGSTLTAAQIATAVWTDTTSSDFSVTGSPGSILTTNLNATVSSRLAASSYVAPTTPPTAAQIATAVLTDTTSTDLATVGSLGYMIGHSPSWYVAPTTPPTPPTVAQIASAVWTDVASTDFGVTGSPGAKLFSIAGSGSTVDPWSVALPGSYATGTAGYIVGHNIDAQVSTRSTYAGGPVQSVVAPVEIDLTEAVPFTNAPNSVGDCLNAARAQGFGKWILSGTTLQLFAPDGVTIVRTFQLDNPDGPTQRI